MPNVSDMQQGSNADYSLSKLFSVAGKTALVTGGSSGLGFIMAQGLLQNGARVIIASRSQKKCDDAMAELSTFGDVVAIAADVTNASQRASLIEQVA